MRVRLTHPPHANILGQQFQSFRVVFHALLLDEDTVCRITSRCGTIDMVVESSDLTTYVGLDPIGCNDKITFNPRPVLELDSGFKLVICLNDL